MSEYDPSNDMWNKLDDFGMSYGFDKEFETK